MKAFLFRIDPKKTALLLVVSAIVTLMATPNLDLVPVRYEEGDIVTQDIVIKEKVILEDERSTALRREQAVSQFAPIYDHDLRLKIRIGENLRAAFDQARKTLAVLQRTKAEALGAIRSNSLEQILVAAELANAKAAPAIFRKERNQVIDEIGMLADLAKPTAAQVFQTEKLRFDLRAVEAQITGADLSLAQLGKRAQQTAAVGERLDEEHRTALVSEDQSILKIKEAFEKTLRTGTDASAFALLVEAQFNQQLEGQIHALLDPVMGQIIVAAPESLKPVNKVIQIQTLDSAKLERFEALETIVDVQKVRSQMVKNAQGLEFPADAAAQREAVIALAQKLVQPNLTENKGETGRLKQELVKSLSPVYFNLKTGDVVARAGDLATAQQVEFIRALNAYHLQNPKYPQLVGTFIIVLLALGLLYQLLVLRVGEEGPGFSRLLLMSILLVATLLLAQLMLAFIPALTTLYDFMPPSTYNFLIPAALTSMLGGILFGYEIAIFLGLATSLFLAILHGNSLPFFIFAMMGSFVAAIPMRHYDTRYALWQQGLRISAINVPVLLVLSLLDQNRLGWGVLFDLGAGLVNGLVVAFLVSTILPLVERAFDITTNMRLLELSNMNHPALKELAVRAPGTYHHSIVVGNLSESAAAGIRANPLLVRVASYYHDLGKMLCPLYFVENQLQANYHDDLPAKTSTRIIINHVKDGLELARKHRLGRTITGILAQHHGTSLVRYFYHKAGEERSGLEETPSEMEYRYPGPRPQTKEAGLVMVADVTEAATRSLENPSPDSIRKMVQKLTTNIYMDGQLDESGMTFNDLNYIEKTFTKMLLSIHHHRITYPDLDIAPRPDIGEAEEELTDDESPDRDIVAGRRASS